MKWHRSSFTLCVISKETDDYQRGGAWRDGLNMWWGLMSAFVWWALGVVCSESKWCISETNITVC